MDTSTSNNPATTELPKNALPIKAILKQAWGYLYGFKATYWLACLILILIAFVFGFAQGLLDPHSFNTAENYSAAQMYSASLGNHFTGAAIIISIISNIVNFLITCGIIYLSIRRVANLPIKTRMMFRAFKSPLIFKLLGLAIIMILIMAGFGLLTFIPFFVFPHTVIAKLFIAAYYVIVFLLYLYVFIHLSLSTPAILDKGLNPFAAIAFSFRSTKGYVWRIFWISFLVVLIILVSIIPVGIGLIWSLPFGSIVLPVIYKRLVGISMKE